MENQSVLSIPDRVPGGSEIGPPRVELLSNILPDDPLLMMGAGPVPIPAAVASANSLVINHLGEVMATNRMSAPESRISFTIAGSSWAEK